MPVGAAAAMGEHLPPPGADCFASTATTTHWLPNFCAASRTSSGRATAAELMLHLSVPASSSRRMSSVERMPPPTVSGRNTRAAVRETTSRMVSRFSWLAVMSRKHSSSAPAASYSAACSTGSPASRSDDEVHALDDAAVLHVQAGNDTQLQHSGCFLE